MSAALLAWAMVQPPPPPADSGGMVDPVPVALATCTSALILARTSPEGVSVRSINSASFRPAVAAVNFTVTSQA